MKAISGFYYVSSVTPIDVNLPVLLFLSCSPFENEGKKGLFLRVHRFFLKFLKRLFSDYFHSFLIDFFACFKGSWNGRFIHSNVVLRDRLEDGKWLARRYFFVFLLSNRKIDAYYLVNFGGYLFMEKKKKRKEKRMNLWKEFKAFISRGSVVDMAVGVIMGSAFGAIVTAFTNILLSVCTWGVPGGIKGLVTVLPAVNDVQKGVEGIGQSFTDLTEATIKYAAASGVVITKDSDTFVQWQNSLKGLYTLHGQTWTYNLSAVIDWGTFINAIISFLIIGITLFSIVKIYNWSKAKRAALEAKLQEDYFLKHPEERPVPPEPGKPAPTEVELLAQIRDELKAMKSSKEGETK